ncbi:glycosyltransferase family 4 protein [Actinomadura fibrosa]|uniref:Glycosyltransferase family 4 protein n=1 Tax=Actinomadura fibrosa TaxID=111802 RepID=A0ABW2XSM7_9ACTN|nr:glycosyltransferase family 4 protein [Actinomadura fibrosa]
MSGDTAGRPEPGGRDAAGPRRWNLVYGAKSPPSARPAGTGDTGTGEPIVGGSGGEASRTESAPVGFRSSGRAPRVLVVADEWFPARGGLSSLNRYLCIALAAAGAEVYCLVPGVSEEERGDAAGAGVRLLAARRLPGMTEREALMRRPPLPPGAEPDMVVGHGRITGQVAKALVEDHFRGAARLHLVHMAPDDIEWYKLDGEDDAGMRADERSRLELDLARDAAAVVPVGPRLHEWLERDLPDDGDGRRPRLLRLDPGFDLTGSTARTPPGGRPLILIMGRMADATLKGLDLAARAIGHAHTLCPGAADWEFLVRGAPVKSEHAVRERVLDLIGHRAANVTVRAYSAETSVIQRDLRRASLALMPSLVEGYGLVGHEAITAGTPTLVGGRSGLGRLIEEVLPAEQARDVVVPIVQDDATDVPVWGHRITAVMTDRAAAFARAAAARRALADRRTWAAAADRLLGVL